MDVTLLPPGTTGNTFRLSMKEFKPLRHGGVALQATIETVGATGVEMEALCAVQGAALTAYDMCKAVDKNMVIANVKVVYKIGGRSGLHVTRTWAESVGREWFETRGLQWPRME